MSFTSTVLPDPDSQVVVQVSEDDFATIMDSDTLNNDQGLVSIPYSLCADTGTTVNVRAFQDTNDNSDWDSGEGAGRDDGSSDGHDAYKDREIPAFDEDENDEEDWHVERNVNFALDETGSI